MYFKTQAEYEAYHSPEARNQRLAAARRDNDLAVTEALQHFLAGDVSGARQTLLAAGVGDDGIAHYLHNWRGE
jgi:hypothetical protein